MARFFYALRPDARAAAELAGLAQSIAATLGGRPLSAHDVHLTLVFIGERPAGEAAPLHAMLTGLAPHWPALPLSRLGSFGRGLWWAGCAGAIPEWPAQLAGQLQQRLRDAGIGFDERPLHLHVTLVRGAHRRSRRPRDASQAAPAHPGPGRRQRADEPSHRPAAPDAPEPSPTIATLAAALPIAPARWTLALGCSGIDPSSKHRYLWQRARG